MDYMTLKEAAGQWGVTPRRVNYYRRLQNATSRINTAFFVAKLK